MNIKFLSVILLLNFGLMQACNEIVDRNNDIHENAKKDLVFDYDAYVFNSGHFHCCGDCSVCCYFLCCWPCFCNYTSQETVIKSDDLVRSTLEIDRD